MTTLTPTIDAVCAEHFGVYRGSWRWSPANRCDSCPLRQPCLAWGFSRAHTFEQLAENRATFVAAAAALLEHGGAA